MGDTVNDNVRSLIRSMSTILLDSEKDPDMVAAGHLLEASAELLEACQLALDGLGAEVGTATVAEVSASLHGAIAKAKGE